MNDKGKRQKFIRHKKENPLFINQLGYLINYALKLIIFHLGIVLYSNTPTIEKIILGSHTAKIGDIPPDSAIPFDTIKNMI